MPGVWEEVHRPAEHGAVPAEKPFGVERLVALGVDASALEEVFGVREVTIRTWLCRSGMQGKKLHERFMAELELVHVQLDELWANVKRGSQDMWLMGGQRCKNQVDSSPAGWRKKLRRWRFQWCMS